VLSGSWQRNRKERDQLRNLGTDGRVILNCIFKEIRREIVSDRSLHTNADTSWRSASLYVVEVFIVPDDVINQVSLPYKATYNV